MIETVVFFTVWGLGITSALLCSYSVAMRDGEGALFLGIVAVFILLAAFSAAPCVNARTCDAFAPPDVEAAR